MGLKNIPSINNIWVYWGCAIITILILKRIVNSSWGYAFRAIRDNEIAAEAMGIGLFKHKLMSFTIGAFFAGIAGALMAFLITSVDPTMFRFLFTFQILLIVVLGGMGSLTGSVISAVVITIMMEVLRLWSRPCILGLSFRIARNENGHLCYTAAPGNSVLSSGLMGPELTDRVLDKLAVFKSRERGSQYE